MSRDYMHSNTYGRKQLQKCLTISRGHKICGQQVNAHNPITTHVHVGTITVAILFDLPKLAVQFSKS